MTPEQRHKNMAAIKGKDTKPEIIVRKYLWGQGFRYRLNHPRLPGKPDVVLLKYRTCIFINGCFWHGHNTMLSSTEPISSDCCKIPKTNREFWLKKILRNMERDKEVQKKLASMGWHCITIWECDLKGEKRLPTLRSLAYTLNHIFLENHRTLPYSFTEDSPMENAAEDAIDYNTNN